MSSIHYCDEEIEHQTAKKKWGHFSFRRFSRCRQLFEGLINTTSSYCLLFKICANGTHLKSVKFLISDVL